MISLDEQLVTINLNGIKVWLSGAIPESLPRESNASDRVKVWDTSDDEGILGFVRSFAGLVFKYGGEIIHGSHPTFTKILLRQAKRFRKSEEKSPLTLVVSDHFKKGNEEDWEQWRETANLVRTAATGFGENDRDPSLLILRESLASRCNAFVAIGGKWWDKVPGRAGVPIEFELAKKRAVPCFVLGGFGGISEKYAALNPEWYNGLNNKLDTDDNQRLARLDDFSMAAGIVVSQLQQFRRSLGAIPSKSGS